MSRFASREEFRRVIEKIFQLMNDDPEVGRRLRDARAPHRFRFNDLGMTFHVTHAEPEEESEGRYLHWTWADEDPWEPMISLEMSSDTANRYFQGKENIAMAVATGRIRIRGPLGKILELGSVTRPVQPLYREWLEEEGMDHLLV